MCSSDLLTGTKHATSYPDPFVLRPDLGLAVAGDARVELDLCTGDRWNVDTWAGAQSWLLFVGDDPLELVEAHALAAGAPTLPPDWAFAPWNDAVGGADRVREVAAALRGAGATSSVIWTEDWKGAEKTAYGYHLTTDWDLDESLYPDASELDAELEAAGFKWLAYFSPFVGQESDNWKEAQDFVITDDKIGRAHV